MIILIVVASFIEYVGDIRYTVRVMSHEAVMSVPLSRPKVHRLPASITRHSRNPLFFSNALLLKAGIMFTAFIVVCVMLNRLIALSSAAHFSLSETMTAHPPTPISDANAAATPMEKHNGNTIIISSGSGTIIGQMAKIPAQNEQITEVKPVTEVDKHAGPELLSIVSKY